MVTSHLPTMRASTGHPRATENGRPTGQRSWRAFRGLATLLVLMAGMDLQAEEELGALWGTADEESKYYPIVDIPVPSGVPLQPGGMEVLPDGRLAVGTRRGDIYFIRGAFDSPPRPEYHLFASGQDEIF